MPRYDYACRCSYVVEETHSIYEDPIVKCPVCSGLMQRVPCAGLTPRVRTHGGYQPGLAQRVNDPEAYVEGPHSLQKLVDKRKRQGYTELKD